MKVADLKNLNPADVVLWLHVEEAAWRLVRAAKLPVSRVYPLHKDSSAAGTLDWDGDDSLGIKLRDSDGKRYELWYIVETIAHEAAHAKTGWTRPEHGREFFKAYGEMLILQEKLRLREYILRAKSGLKP